MEYNKHYNLSGKHAILSASQYHWLNYTPEGMRKSYENKLKKEEGTYLHDLASRLIKTHTYLKPLKKAFNQFVNDSIGYGMESELVLYYSDNCFGTADAIKYDEENGLLRIHDLKTGITKPSFNQLNIYAALFCLEYSVDPFDINFEERLYQGFDFEINSPDQDLIREIMDKIIEMDQVVTQAMIEYKGIF